MTPRYITRFNAFASYSIRSRSCEHKLFFYMRLFRQQLRSKSNFFLVHEHLGASSHYEKAFIEIFFVEEVTSRVERFFFLNLKFDMYRLVPISSMTSNDNVYVNLIYKKLKQMDRRQRYFFKERFVDKHLSNDVFLLYFS